MGHTLRHNQIAMYWAWLVVYSTKNLGPKHIWRRPTVYNRRSDVIIALHILTENKEVEEQESIVL